MLRRRALALAALLALAAGGVGCKEEGKGSSKTLTRHGNLPPVVVVDRQLHGATNVTDEVEPNDDAEAPMKVDVPGGVKGTLASEEDVDLYRITVPDDGMLDVQVSGIEGVDLQLDVFSSEIGNGDKVWQHFDRGPAGVVEGAPNLPVHAGAVVTMKVSEYLHHRKGKNVRTEPSPPYRLTFAVTKQAGESEESEPNEDVGGAKELLLGDRGTGYLGWNGDRDSWKVSLLGFSEGHTLDLDVSPVPGVELTVTLYDASGKEIASRTGGKGQGLFMRNVVPGTGGEFARVVVSGNKQNPVDRYTLRASSRALEPGDETEPNQTAEQASRVAEDGMSSGQARGVLGGGDVDVLMLPAPSESSVLSLTLEVPPSGDYELSVAQGGAVLGTANAGKAGVGERLVGVPVEAGKPIYVTVSGTYDSDEPSDYRLDWKVAIDEGGWTAPPAE